PLALIHQQWIDRYSSFINEGLMTLFFLMIGLELKQGYLGGEFGHISQVALPLIGAIGGMIVPALIYIYFNYHDSTTLRGWSIPTATDIAFALGALSLFGKRVPVPLKLFLMALAIFDDIGAIIIIALFYSHGLSLGPLVLSGLLLLLLGG